MSTRADICDIDELYGIGEFFLIETATVYRRFPHLVIERVAADSLRRQLERRGKRAIEHRAPRIEVAEVEASKLLVVRTMCPDTERAIAHSHPVLGRVKTWAQSCGEMHVRRRVEPALPPRGDPQAAA